MKRHLSLHTILYSHTVSSVRAYNTGYKDASDTANNIGYIDNSVCDYIVAMQTTAFYNDLMDASVRAYNNASQTSIYLPIIPAIYVPLSLLKCCLYTLP
jgi:hypothetical protein